MRTKLALFAASAAIAALSAFAPAQAASWDDRRDWRRVERELRDDRWDDRHDRWDDRRDRRDRLSWDWR